MKKISITLIAMTLVLFSALSIAATKAPSIGITLEKFENSYNKAAEELRADKMDISSFNFKDGEKADLYYSDVNPFSRMIISTNKGDKRIVGIILRGQGDGTPASGAQIMLAMFGTIIALTPDMTKEQRKAKVLERIGFYGEMVDGREREVQLKGFKIVTDMREDGAYLTVVK